MSSNGDKELNTIVPNTKCEHTLTKCFSFQLCDVAEVTIQPDMAIKNK